MKKTNLFIIVLCIMVLTLTGCGTDKTKILNENMKKIDFTGDLITYQAYYHNIIEYDKQKDSFLEKNRKLFAEYTRKRTMCFFNSMSSRMTFLSFLIIIC